MKKIKRRTIYGVLHLLASVIFFVLCVACVKQMMLPEMQAVWDSLSYDDPVWTVCVAVTVGLSSAFYGAGLFSDGMKLIFFDDRSRSSEGGDR